MKVETGASPSQDGGMEGEGEEWRGEGGRQRHLNWTGLASRGRWTMDVKFLKGFLVKKQINPISQSDSLIGSLPLPASAGEFSRQQREVLFFLIIVAVTIETSSLFFFSFSFPGFVEATLWNVPEPREFPSSENSSSSSVTQLDCFLFFFFFLLEILALFLEHVLPPFLKKE